MVADVPNVDFWPNLSDCSLARVQVRVYLPRHYAFAAYVTPHKILLDF